MCDKQNLPAGLEGVTAPMHAMPVGSRNPITTPEPDSNRKEGSKSDSVGGEVQDAQSERSSPSGHTNGNDTGRSQGVQGENISHGEADEDIEEDAKTADSQPEKKTKKKTKRKPKSQRGLKAPSGFEEYYVDPPLTPEQHQEQLGLYEQRIETAIQRYTARRKLDTERSVLLDKYLVYGGIQGGVKMFSGGLDANVLADSSAAEIAAMTAKYTVPFDGLDENSKAYVVDFEGCLKGFLSTHFPSTFDTNGKGSIEKYVGVLRNFLNYLLHHDVCPEYRGQVEKAKAFCTQAERELCQIVEVQPLLPGSFNKACSMLFGGAYFTSPSSASDWADERDSLASMSSSEARNIFKIGLAAYGSDKQLSDCQVQRNKQDFHLVKCQDVCLQIVDIEIGAAAPDFKTVYENEGKDLPRLGKLITRIWNHPGAMEEDLTREEEEEEVENGLHVQASQPANYEFWLDDAILEKLVKGMKFTASVKELSFGVLYFDTADTLLASFYTLLPNDSMLGWRKVEEEWLAPRPKFEAKERAAEGEEVKRSADGDL